MRAKRCTAFQDLTGPRIRDHIADMPAQLGSLDENAAIGHRPSCRIGGLGQRAERPVRRIGNSHPAKCRNGPRDQRRENGPAAKLSKTQRSHMRDNCASWPCWQPGIAPASSGLMDRQLIAPVLLMSVGMLLIPFGDTAGKLMTESGVHPFFVAWARYALGIVVLVPFVLSADLLRLLADWRIWLRSAFQVLTIVTILTALSSTGIAEVYGAFFLGPIISYVLSVWLLKESASALRVILLLIGFCGVLLVVRPSLDMSSGLIWALVSGCFYGMFLTASRWLAPLGKPKHLLLSQLIIGALVMTPLGALHMPAEVPLGLIAWSGLASMFGNLFLVLAYARAGATTLAPFVYVQLLGATAYGVAFFERVPDILSAVGIAVIFASGFATLFLRSNRPAP
jgi:drug/metabolite transporter (DMT)-like permease